MFTLVESIVTKSGKALGIFKKDWHDMIADFKNTKGLKNKIQAMFSKTISDEDIKSLKYYNAQINAGVSPQTAFTRCLRNSSTAAQNLAISANGAAVSEESLGKAAEFATIKQQILSTAMQVGFALAITTIITLISKAVNYQKELAEEHLSAAQINLITTQLSLGTSNPAFSNYNF